MAVSKWEPFLGVQYSLMADDEDRRPQVFELGFSFLHSDRDFDPFEQHLKLKVLQGSHQGVD